MKEGGREGARWRRAGPSGRWCSTPPFSLSLSLPPSSPSLLPSTPSGEREATTHHHSQRKRDRWPLATATMISLWVVLLPLLLHVCGGGGSDAWRPAVTGQGRTCKCVQFGAARHLGTGPRRLRHPTHPLVGQLSPVPVHEARKANSHRHSPSKSPCPRRCQIQQQRDRGRRTHRMSRWGRQTRKRRRIDLLGWQWTRAADPKRAPRSARCPKLHPRNQPRHHEGYPLCNSNQMWARATCWCVRTGPFEGCHLFLANAEAFVKNPPLQPESVVSCKELVLAQGDTKLSVRSATALRSEPVWEKPARAALSGSPDLAQSVEEFFLSGGPSSSAEVRVVVVPRHQGRGRWMAEGSAGS